ncbi:MAG: AAA family ATPase [Candidatus Micrarchaeales archaeon]|jgi:dephospho-CoA kinase
MIVCVIGMPGAGKSQVADVLRRMDFRTYELGDVVRGMMKEQDIEITPESLRKFSIVARRKYGYDYEARRLIKKINLKEGNIAIVGFRTKANLDFIKKHAKVTSIAVIAPAKIRYLRLSSRRRPDDPKTMTEFMRQRDRKEIRFGILKVIKGADYVIANTGTVADLKKSVQMVMDDAGLV